MEQDQKSKNLAQYAAEQNYKKFEELFNKKVRAYINSDPEIIECNKERIRLTNLLKRFEKDE